MHDRKSRSTHSNDLLSRKRKPAGIQNTEPSRILSEDAGLFRFKNLKQAAQHLNHRFGLRPAMLAGSTVA